MVGLSRLVMALLKTLPLLIQLLRDWHKQKKVAQSEKEIDDDPLGEWSNRFGQLRDDTYSDPAARCLCDPSTTGNSVNSPEVGGGDLSSKEGCSKTTEVRELP